MTRGLSVFKNWRSILVIAGVLLTVALLSAEQSFGTSLNAPGTGQSGEPGKVQREHGAASGPIVGQATHFHVSQALRSLPPEPPILAPGRDEGPENPILPGYYTSRWVQDTVVQTTFAPLVMPTPIQNFDGLYNYWGPIPPDTNGEVGPNHFVQIVNNGFQVFSKTGAALSPPFNTNVLWRGLGGACETRNDGDPIVLYDQLADRWNISQFTSAAPYYQCIAVSTSGDPLGSWYQYAFFESNSVFGDYPHLGVWPDGYYMTVNQFGAGSGGGNYAFERNRMLVGDPSARFVYFNTPSGAALPSDMDGFTPPPAGSPNFFLFPTNSTAGVLSEYKFRVDWSNPLSSTFTGPITMTVAPWNPSICDATRGQCIDQPNTTTKLETLGDRFMFRLAYRNFGDHETLVANHTVNITTTNPGMAGIRWYEIRNPNGAPSVFQQGTYTQPDNTHRWMGSIAMDHQGNIGLGFSASSSVISPSVRYAGRLVTDPLGQMAQGEGLFHQGNGVENFANTGRWGDYSDLTVDPTDDCTFWFTTEYFGHTGDRVWRTRIGSFRFPSCASIQTPTPTYTPMSTPTGTATSTPTNTPTACVIAFSDVPPTHPFYDYVRCLYCSGAVSGYNDGTFRPYNTTTRGQVAHIVVIAFRLPINTTGGPHFSDVPVSHQFYASIETAYNAGLVSGYTDGTFRPGSEVTRGQLAKIVVQAAIVSQGWVLINPTTPSFSDVSRAHAFYSFIETAICHRIIGGYSGNTFRPDDNAARAHVAKLVCLAMRNQVPCQGLPPSRTPTTTHTPTGTSTRPPVSTPLNTPINTPTFCPGGASYTGSLVSGDRIQQGRINRSGAASTCALPKPFPGTAPDSNPRRFDTYVYTNTTNLTQCVSVRVSEACGDNHLLSAAYLGTYNPFNLSLNYLADFGVGGQTFSYSFNVPPGRFVTIVVTEGTGNVGCDEYTISISPCVPVPTATHTVTPTATPTENVCSGTTYAIATATGTMLPATQNIGNSCDDCTSDVVLPFPITIYDQVYATGSRVRAGSNGNLQFASDQPNIFPVACIPVTSANPGFRSTIFPYYDDLRTDGGNEGEGIFTDVLGTAPNRQFVVRWHTTYFSRPGLADFELVFTEGSTSFSSIYGASEERGLNAGVGVQRSLAVYTQFSCTTALLAPGLQLNFTTSPLSCTPTPVRTNTFTPTATLTPTPTQTPQVVLIQGFAFVPQTLTISVGTTIRWTNLDAAPHTATSLAVPPVWDSGILNQNQSYDSTFYTAGTYPYYCVVHPNMTGTINVTP